MKTEFREYKGVGYLSHVCDLCGVPIKFLTYKGRDGEYCSNRCFEAAERKETTMSVKKSAAKAAKTPKAATAPTRSNEEVFEETPIMTHKAAPGKKTKIEAPVEVPKAKAGKKTKVDVPVEAPKTKVSKAKKSEVQRLACPFREGSANAAVFNLLGDGEVHTLDECYETAIAAGSTKYPKDALWFVTKRGADSQDYTIVKDKAAGTVQMTV